MPEPIRVGDVVRISNWWWNRILKDSGSSIPLLATAEVLEIDEDDGFIMILDGEGDERWLDHCDYQIDPFLSSANHILREQKHE